MEFSRRGQMKEPPSLIGGRVSGNGDVTFAFSMIFNFIFNTNANYARPSTSVALRLKTTVQVHWD